MYRDYMDCQLIHGENGESEIRLQVDDRVANGRGVLHGGALCALADSAVSVAIRTLLPEGRGSVTASLTVEFLRPVAIGATLSVRGHAVHVGQGLAAGRAEALVDGRLVGMASGVWRVLDAAAVPVHPTAPGLGALMAAWDRLDLARIAGLPPAHRFHPVARGT